MQHVGEAVRQRANVDNKINVLGIAPWGVLQNNNKLISKVSKSRVLIIPFMLFGVL